MPVRASFGLSTVSFALGLVLAGGCSPASQAPPTSPERSPGTGGQPTASGGSSGTATGGSAGSTTGSGGSAAGTGGAGAGGASGGAGPAAMGGASGGSGGAGPALDAGGGAGGNRGGTGGASPGDAAAEVAAETGPAPAVDPLPAGPTFSKIFAEVLQPSCALAACHARANPPDGIDMKSKMAAYASLTGKAITKGNPRSKLVTLLESRRMPPPPRAAVPAAKIAEIKAWIVAGAPND
jgi:hypothetical protein